MFPVLLTRAVNRGEQGAREAPVDTSVQLLSAQLEQPVHGRGDWKEANM